jgi:hypothetical protein
MAILQQIIVRAVRRLRNVGQRYCTLKRCKLLAAAADKICIWNVRIDALECYPDDAVPVG